MIELIQNEFEWRLKDESLQRILRCLDIMSEQSIWYSPNDQVNSVANMILHLSGNIGQYILSGIGGQKDIRQRDLEFSTHKTTTKSELKKLIKNTIEESVEVVNEMSQGVLIEEKDVQCFKMTGLSILVHVIEHTSYHTGQITQLCKWIHDVDTQYYPDLDLNKTV